MKKNMGNIDKIVRVIVALVIGGLYFTGAFGETLGYILVAVAAIFLLTSAIGFCPLYAPFGLSTSPSEKDN